jgi:hypothetical protein
MLTGRCLCGDVRFEIDRNTGPLAYCHCESCRRASGSAFGANADVRVANLRWLAGRETLREYESSPGKLRAFCPRCGSPVFSRRVDQPEIVRIRFGLLDADPGRRPFGHFFVSEKAAWYEIADAVPQHAGGTPDPQP